MGDPLLKIVLRQRAAVVAAVLVCVAAAGAYLCVATPQYTSTARLQVRRTGPRIIGEAQSAQTPEENFLFTQREVISSTPVLTLALSKLSKPGAADPRVLGGVNDRLAWLKQAVEVEVGKKDELVSVSFAAPDPQEANRVVAAVVDAYTAYQSGQRQSTAAEVLDILAKEKKAREAELAQKTRVLLEYGRKYGLPGAAPAEGDRYNAVVQRLAALSDVLITAQRATAEARLAHVEVAQSTLADPRKAAAVARLTRAGAGGSAADPAQVRQQMVFFQAKLRELQQRYLPGHPAVKALQGQLDELDLEYAAAVESRYQVALRLESDARAALEAQQAAVEEQRSRAAQYAWLQSEVTVAQKHVEALDSRMKEVNLTEDGGAPRITTLEAPHTGSKPDKPRASRVLALAAVAGLLLGACLACARDWYGGRLRSPAEAQAALGLPVIGAVPVIPELASASAPWAVAEPAAEMAALYLSIRKLARSKGPGGRDGTILVTSPAAGDGKSTVAGQLAVFLAWAGRRVLLVDANLRSPRQAAGFDMDQAPGLGDSLAGRVGASSLIRRTGLKGMDLLPAGKASADAGSLLNSTRLGDLLEQLADDYDHVVIDSPSLRDGPEARILAASCDVTLLVLSDRTSSRRTGSAACKALASVGADMVAVVLNAGGRPASHKPGQIPGQIPMRPAVEPALEEPEASTSDQSLLPSPAAAEPRRMVAIRDRL